MTHKEAIHILDGFDLRNNADKYDLEALDMACDALEKQISHKDSWHQMKSRTLLIEILLIVGTIL